MKGVIFNLLEEAVTAEFGADVWDQLLDGAELDGVYTSLGDYPDRHAHDLVGAASRRLAISEPEVLKWFGRRAMPMLQERYGTLFDGKGSSRAFITSVNSMIHPEVRKLYPQARCPFFGFTAGDGGVLLVDYDSPRRMCHLAQGFVEGAAALWNEQVTVTHRRCVHDGADSCQLAVTWH